MMYLLSVLAVLVAISAIPIVLSDSMRGDFTVPNWVKNTAGWWADGKIPDSSFIETIEFLIKDEMITVKIPDLDSVVANKIPAWVKNTAGWWAEDKVHDTTFVAAIRYLVSQGIVYVEQEQVEVAKCNFKGKEVVCSPFEKEVEEITDFYMELNGSNCCLNWAYVGKEYRFQIETYDEQHGKSIDDVKISAKIISKDGELRHNFGEVTTEDGFYKNSITIPNMDWYAGNILSVTGEYYGVEKTIEKEFEVFKKSNVKLHCFKISCYTIKSVSNVSDNTNLDGVRGVETFTIGPSTYVVTAAQLSDKIVIYDISDPSNPTSVGSLADTDDGNSGNTYELEGPIELDIATIGGKPYAVVAAYDDDGIEIIDISDPTNPTSVGSLADGGTRKLNNPYDVAITTIGDSTYAVVTAYWDHGIDVIDISDPTNPTSVGTEADTGTIGATVWDCVSSLGTIGDHRCLRHPVDVEITTIGGSTYAVVAGSGDDGIEIIDISDPTNPEEAGRMTDRDDRTRELNGANGVAITTIGSSTYAVVTGTLDDGISIIDISTPSTPVYVSELEDGTDTGVCTAGNDERCLDGPRDVEIETINGLTYAFVVSYLDDALTIIDKACIIIEVEREGLGDNLAEMKKNAREIADEIVADGVIVFAPEFYSISFQQKNSLNGDIAKGSVAKVVYTIHLQSTGQLFTALSTMLLSNDIRTSGGFYDIAEKLSENYFSEFAVIMTPLENGMLRELHISLLCSNEIRELVNCERLYSELIPGIPEGTIDKQIARGYVSPLDFIQVENISRSKIFSDEFLPLNSVIQVLILSEEDLQVKSVNSNVIENLQTLGDIQESGWFFTSKAGQKIDGRYIFGPEYSVSKNDLAFSIGSYSENDIEIKKVEGGGGCLIATAAFGSELSPQVQFLREIRDNTVLQTESGTSFMAGFNQFYYSFSPTIADYERENPVFKEAVKLTLTPLLTSLTLLQYADIDSESEMLGYGIGIILLNIGMYFVAPAILIMFRKQFVQMVADSKSQH